MNYQKGFIAPLLLALIALLILGGGAYVYVQNKQANPTAQGLNSQTANWNTYTNVQYGFEFKYPATYVAMQTKDGILLTSSNVVGGNITFYISTVQTIQNVPDQINNCPISTHEIECSNNVNEFGVRYTRAVNTGQLREDKQQQLNAQFFNSKVMVQMNTPFRNETTSVFDGILQSIKFITPATLTAENAKNSVISQCGVKLTIKTNQTVSSQDIAPGNNDGGYINRQYSVESTPKSNLQIECVARNNNSPKDVSYYLSVQSDGSSEVNKNDYPVFDQQTMSSITKLYSAKNRGYREGSETIGFETKDWIYTFSFTNSEQAKNQNTFVISVANPI